MALAQVQVTSDGLIDWYLDSVASDIQSERQLDEHVRLVQLIINKLIDQERICVDGKGGLSSPGWEPTRDERDVPVGAATQTEPDAEHLRCLSISSFGKLGSIFSEVPL